LPLIFTTDSYQCHFNSAHGQPTCKALYHRDLQYGKRPPASERGKDLRGEKTSRGEKTQYQRGEKTSSISQYQRGGKTSSIREGKDLQHQRGGKTSSIREGKRPPASASIREGERPPASASIREGERPPASEREKGKTSRGNDL
jgi:hypothetical protein